MKAMKQVLVLMSSLTGFNGKKKIKVSEHGLSREIIFALGSFEMVNSLGKSMLYQSGDIVQMRAGIGSSSTCFMRIRINKHGLFGVIISGEDEGAAIPSGTGWWKPEDKNLHYWKVERRVLEPWIIRDGKLISL